MSRKRKDEGGRMKDEGHNRPVSSFIVHPSSLSSLPWPFTAVALVAMAALFASSNGFIAQPALALLLILHHFIPWRLPDSRVISWVVRAMLWTLVIGFSPELHSTGMAIFFEPDYVYLFGHLCATELVLRVWMTWPSGAPSRGESFFLSALIIVAASDTYDRTYLRLLTPVYAAMVLLASRWFVQAPTQPSQSSQASQTRRPLLLSIRVFIALVAVSLGFVTVASVTRFDQTLTSWAVDLVNATRRGHAGRIGLTMMPRLQTNLDPQVSMDRVLIIDGPYASRHLRARAFDTYENTQWRSRSIGSSFRDVDGPALQTSVPGNTLDVTVLGDTPFDVLLLPLNTARVESVAPLERDDMGSVRHRQPVSNARYSFTVAAQERFQGPLCLPIADAQQRQRYLAIPKEIDPKVLQLANRIAPEGSPLTRVLRIAQQLRATHGYSLRYDPGRGEPLSNFILSDSAAHCQFFASALTIMARAIGVPSRLVIGYYAHETSDSQRVVVRERDAHAWAECWIDGVGWITLDATPAGGLPDQLYGPPSRLRRAWEAVQDFPGQVRDWLSRLSRRTLLQVVFATASLALIVQLIQSRRRRRANAEQPYAAPQAELVGLGKRFDQWLGRVGQPCAPNRTWREHVQSARQASGCANFLQAWDEARFGGADGQIVSRLRELMEELERHPISQKPEH